MIARLIETLQLLAAAADQPRAPSAEVARDFADAYRLVCDCPQLHLTSEQKRVLNELDGRLEDMTEPDYAPLEERAAGQQSVPWAQVQRMARQALQELGE